MSLPGLLKPIRPPAIPVRRDGRKLDPAGFGRLDPDHRMIVQKHAERLGVPAPEAMTDGSEPTYRDFSEGFDPDSWLDRAITETRASVFPEHGIDPMSW